MIMEVLVELDDEGLCCGAGGAYALSQPELASAIRELKVAAIARAGAPMVASANPGCALHLAAAGVVGPFAIDFSVVSPPQTPPDIRLSEINLRLGGTTHPFAMARIVTRAHADAATGLHTDDGDRVYVATDNLKESSLVGVSPAQIIAGVDDAGLAFDPRTRTGVTLHLLGAVERYGKRGAVCIARSHDQADALLARLTALLRR